MGYTKLIKTQMLQRKFIILLNNHEGVYKAYANWSYHQKKSDGLADIAAEGRIYGYRAWQNKQLLKKQIFFCLLENKGWRICEYF